MSSIRITDRPAGVPHGTVIAALLLTATLGGSTASAAEPARSPWILGLSPIYSFIVLDQNVEPDGGGGALIFQYRFDQTFGLQLSGMWSGHTIASTEETPGGFLQMITASAALRYAIDVIPYSPAIEAGVELLHQRYADDQASSQSNEFGVQVGLAFDYWIIPRLAMGGAFHYHALLTDVADFPVYFDLGLRLLTRWP